MKLKASAFCAAQAALCASTVFGQSLTTDEVVVEGGSRDTRQLLETPNAVSVVGAEEIERRQASTYEELIGDVPGVTIEGGPRGISQEPNIRGFQDEQIVLRVDGARQNFNLAHRGRFFTDPAVLDRIEVLRGGQSTLFGSGALGGVILLETKDPADILEEDELWGGGLRIGYNSQGSEFKAAGTIAFQAGDFDGMAFLTYRPMSGDLTDGDGNDILNSEIDSESALLKFGYNPGDHRFELSYQGYQDEGLTPPNANAAATPTNVVNRDLTFQTARIEWTWEPEDNDLFDVSTLFYFNHAEVGEDRPSDGRRDNTVYRTFGFEVVNRSDFELVVPVQLSYGVEAYLDQQEATRNGGPRPQAPDAEAQYFAVFAQADLDLGHGVTLTPGLRFDYFKVDPDGAFPNLSESELSPKLALQWQPTKETQLWVSASQSFRAPSLTELYNDGTHFSTAAFPFVFGPGTFFTGNNNFVATPSLEPERARQVEVGGRYSANDVIFQGDILRFSANAYYSQVSNFIDTVVVFADPTTATFDPVTGLTEFSGTTTNRNVDATLWGFEVEVAYDTEDWFASVGLTVPRGLNQAGGDLGSIPQDRLTITGGIRPITDLDVGARLTFLDGQDDVSAGGATTPGTVILDLFATYAPTEGPLEGVSFAAGVDNVTDRTYRIHPNGLNQAGRAFKVSASIPF